MVNISALLYIKLTVKMVRNATLGVLFYQVSPNEHAPGPHLRARAFVARFDFPGPANTSKSAYPEFCKSSVTNDKVSTYRYLALQMFL